MLRKITIFALLGVALVAVIWFAPQFWPEEEKDELALVRADFADFDSWADDDHAVALSAFGNACQVLMRQKPGDPVKPERIGGHVSDWLSVCERAATIMAEGGPGVAREFFETNFTPLAVFSGGTDVGKFTGYYEPLIEGSWGPDPSYPVPAYGRPPELVMVDLGLFRSDLAGRRVAGRVMDGRLQPYDDRTEIETGTLADRGLEVMWLKRPVDLFFLQIQGSGRVQLPDGSLVGLGYDGLNGHPYVAIGWRLVERGEVPKEDMSMQAIRSWIAENPSEGIELMRENPSYVFFRILDRGGPEGSLGTVLTPGRSLAVDRTKLPLGAPLWLEGSHPDPSDPTTEEKDMPLARLMIAEDTGGAIKGAVRGDVFWGLGEDAEAIAGAMNNEGRFYILLPNALAGRILSRENENDTAVEAP